MYSGIIYCAIFPNNKKYYGKTKNNLNDRIKKHILDSKKDNLLFHRALKKYNEKVKWIVKENFCFEKEIDLLNMLNERESYWIETDKTFVLKFGIKYGYNLTPGGDGGDTFSGRIHSNKTKEKMRKSRLKHLKKHGNVLKGRIRPEHSALMTGENNPMFGKGYLIQGDKNGKRKLKKLIYG